LKVAHPDFFFYIHAKKEIVALYKEIVEGTISDGWI